MRALRRARARSTAVNTVLLPGRNTHGRKVSDAICKLVTCIEARRDKDSWIYRISVLSFVTDNLHVPVRRPGALEESNGAIY